MASILEAQVIVIIRDTEHLHPSVSSEVNVRFNEPEDPMASATLTALRAAVESLEGALPFLGGRQ